MNDVFIIIGISGLIILSYVFNLIANRFRIPAVLLLLALGMATRQFAQHYGFEVILPHTMLAVLGSAGLILIVLEGTLDIKFSKEKNHILRGAFGVSLLLLILSSLLIAYLIEIFIGSTFRNAILYAIPLSIISSAIVIPSVKQLVRDKREFMIYESTFSDIIGILLFNFFAFSRVSSYSSVLNYSGSFLITVIISLIFSIVLIWAMEKITTRIRFYLILAIVALLYETGKLFHLSSLLLVLCFGLALNNIEALSGKTIDKYFNIHKIQLSLRQFKPMIIESSFVIRTLFFFVFGYSIHVTSLLNPDVLVISILLVVSMYLLRYVNLKFFIRTTIFPEIFIAPRGLITILLFYSIPQNHRITYFSEDILFIVILLTSLIMMLAIMFSKQEISKEGLVDYS